MRWIKWFQYENGKLINFGQMPIMDVAKHLNKFERQASKVLKETNSDHVVYGLKIYDENGSLECIKFYMIAMFRIREKIQKVLHSQVTVIIQLKQY